MIMIMITIMIAAMMIMSMIMTTKKAMRMSMTGFETVRFEFSVRSNLC